MQRPDSRNPAHDKEQVIQVFQSHLFHVAVRNGVLVAMAAWAEDLLRIGSASDEFQIVPLLALAFETGYDFHLENVFHLTFSPFIVLDSDNKVILYPSYIHIQGKTSIFSQKLRPDSSK